MNKITIFIVSGVITFVGLVFLLPTGIDWQLSDEYTVVTVLMSADYYSSYEGRIIRAELYRQLFAADEGERGRRFIYRVVRRDDAAVPLSSVVNQAIGDGADIIVSFEQQFTAELSQIAASFPTQRFYLTAATGAVSSDFSSNTDNIYLILVETDLYNYLLGYFASLIFHYRFTEQPQAETAIITVDDFVNEDGRRAVARGVQSIAAEHAYQYLELASSADRDALFALFERLRSENTEIAIILGPTFPRSLFRAARRNNIRLITHVPHRYLRRTQIANSEIRWAHIITNRLIPHMRYGRARNIRIDAHAHYYRLWYRIRGSNETGMLITMQFDALIEKIVRREVNIVW